MIMGDTGVKGEQDQEIAKAGAVKYDAGKPPVLRGAIAYFPRAIEAVAAISTFGASKYAWNGWLYVPDGIDRYANAMVRHIIAKGKGQVLDPESGLPHSWHTLWNAAAVVELELIEAEMQEPSK